MNTDKTSRPQMNADKTSLPAVRKAIITCERCPRLRRYCRDVARVKKLAFRDENYWGKPVPGFGDPRARILILGLAPAAHGANRTGRVFTGDGPGASGDFLMSALNRAGFANIPTSQHPDDGLKLKDVYVAAAVRCAPPDNKPTPQEVDTCLEHLANEVEQLPRLEVVVALGKIAWDAWLKLATRQGIEIPSPKPRFGHKVRCTLGTPRTPRTLRTVRTVRTLIGCYHPSRQNTNTGVVTPAMYDDIFQRL